MIVIDEFTAMRARAIEMQVGGLLDQRMQVISAEAAATGLHLVLIDQRPDFYPGTLKVNTYPVIFQVTDQYMSSAVGRRRTNSSRTCSTGTALSFAA